MNILLDFITVRIRSGAGEYCRRVYYELLNILKTKESNQINLFALYDSSKGIAYEDLTEEVLKKLYKIKFIDCYNKRITDIIAINNIDRFFVGCVQFVAVYKEIEDLKCEIICVIHDARDEEFLKNHMYEYCQLTQGGYEYKNKYNSIFLNKLRLLRLTYLFAVWFFKLRHNGLYKQRLELVPIFYNLLKKNNKAYLIAVSEYTKYSVLYNWKIPQERIKVLYSPEKKIIDNNIGDDEPKMNN